MVVESMLFFAGCEAWKWAKRIFFRRRARKEGGSKDLDGESPNMAMASSPTNSSEKVDGRKESTSGAQSRQ